MTIDHLFDFLLTIKNNFDPLVLVVFSCATNSSVVQPICITGGTLLMSPTQYNTSDLIHKTLPNFKPSDWLEVVSD